MASFKPLLQLGIVFVLTTLLCSALVGFLDTSPLCDIGFLCIGTLAVLWLPMLFRVAIQVAFESQTAMMLESHAKIHWV